MALHAPLAGLLALLLLTGPTLARAAEAREEPFRLSRFDSETGRFDASLSAADRKNLWMQWKKARRVNGALNPEKAQGCGTHVNLHVKWLLQTPYLPGVTLFLVRPGKRLCDFDEKCVVLREARTCAHTQYMRDFPVAVGPQGPYSNTIMDAAFFNMLVRSQPVSVENVQEAEGVARLYLHLSTLGNRNIVSRVSALECVPGERDFRVRASMVNATEPTTREIELTVARDGTVTVLEGQ